VAADGSGAILVVDDEPNVAEGFTRDVYEAGWRPVVANSLHDAAAYLDEPLTGMIVDVFLPDGSGLTLIREARAKKPRLPILMVTGAHNSEIANEAHLLGVEYACKPGLRANVVAFLARCAPSAIERVSELLLEIEQRYTLTPAEVRLVGAAIEKSAHDRLARVLCVSANTVKKRVAGVLEKTGAATLEDFVAPLRSRALHR
jgi:two-component system OmpR family response regulator